MYFRCGQQVDLVCGQFVSHPHVKLVDWTCFYCNCVLWLYVYHWWVLTNCTTSLCMHSCLHIDSTLFLLLQFHALYLCCWRCFMPHSFWHCSSIFCSEECSQFVICSPFGNQNVHSLPLCLWKYVFNTISWCSVRRSRNLYPLEFVSSLNAECCIECSDWAWHSYLQQQLWCCELELSLWWLLSGHRILVWFLLSQDLLDCNSRW